MIPPYLYMQPMATRNCNCAEPMPAWATTITLTVLIIGFILLLPMIFEAVLFSIDGYKEIIRKIKVKIKIRKLDK